MELAGPSFASESQHSVADHSLPLSSMGESCTLSDTSAIVRFLCA